MNPGSVSHVFVDRAGVGRDECARMAVGLQAQLREDFAPEYGAGEDDVVRADNETVAEGEVEIRIHTDAPANEDDALAIHGRKPDGTPVINAYKALAERCGVSLSSCISHELLEARADPDLTECVQLPDGRIAAKEICDQVEATSYTKDGVEVSNFNTRANFAPRPDGKPEKYDFLGKQSKPFEVLDGGYAQVLDPNKGWVQLPSEQGMRAYRAELERLGLSRNARRASPVAA